MYVCVDGNVCVVQTLGIKTRTCVHIGEGAKSMNRHGEEPGTREQKRESESYDITLDALDALNVQRLPLAQSGVLPGVPRGTILVCTH